MSNLVEKLCPNCCSEDVKKVRKDIYQCNNCGIQVREQDLTVTPYISHIKRKVTDDPDDYDDVYEKLLEE